MPTSQDLVTQFRRCLDAGSGRKEIDGRSLLSVYGVVSIRCSYSAITVRDLDVGQCTRYKILAWYGITTYDLEGMISIGKLDTAKPTRRLYVESWLRDVDCGISIA